VAATPKAERISRWLLEGIARYYRQGDVAFNARLIRQAQSDLTPSVQSDELDPESATTVVLAEIRNGYATVLNTGDSRAYLIDKITGKFRRLSKDHTVFELLKKEGEIAPAAQDCDFGNLATGLLEAVTAAPMAEQDFEVHMDYARLQENQVVLLCSDGVTAHLRDSEIAVEVVKANFLGQDACERIVDTVLDRGASDNTTVVLVQLGENETSPKKE
jgi:protein phosphatase